MINDSTSRENGINGPQTKKGHSETLGMDSWAQQSRLCHHPVTTRMKWKKPMNKVVMKCYIRSDPSIRGYKKKMWAIWNEEVTLEISEQRLVDQARTIKTNGWFSDLELEEIKRNTAADTRVKDAGREK